MNIKTYWKLFIFMSLLGCASKAPQVNDSHSKRNDKLKQVHLFILSGQSNMVGMKADQSFSPIIEEAFGKDNVIVVKDAHGGQSIRSWVMHNHEDPPPTVGRVPKVRGALYQKLLEKVKAATSEIQFKTLTFVWMQGESDARNTAYEIYLRELIGQLKRDLEFEKINVVIGRISDCGIKGPISPGPKYSKHKMMREGRLKIRKIQEEFTKTYPRAALVNTDDLNDMMKKGRMIDDLHYTKEGYQTLGRRFAESSIALIRKFDAE